MSRSVRLLWIWFLVFQAGHLAVNARGLAMLAAGRGIDFPAPAPPGGWTPQTLVFLKAFAVVDLAVAAISVVAALAVLSGRLFWRWPALLCVAAAIYAAVVFDLATWWAGAWQGTALWSYLAVNAQSRRCWRCCC